MHHTFKNLKEYALDVYYQYADVSSFIDIRKALQDEKGVAVSDEKAILINNALASAGYIKCANTKESANGRITGKGIDYVESLREETSSEEISEVERDQIKSMLDEILERIKKLELGQQIAYDDLDKRFDELLNKDLLRVGKQKFLEMLLGTLVKHGLTEALDSAIEVINDHSQGLLGQ
jgi:hypothetical protein